MIGFDPLLQGLFNANPEGLDTKNLDKKQVYEMVAKDYFLPPCYSRGITREYLLDVKVDKVFRITNGEWKRFEYTLEAGHLRKVSMITNGLLLRKLNTLLKSKGLKEMGFPNYEVPEQDWLYKMARFVDRSNLLEFFELPVEPEPLPTPSSSSIVMIHYGRLFTGEYLFDSDRKKNNKKLWGYLKSLSEAYRNLMGTRMCIETLEYDLQRSKEQLAAENSHLQDILNKAALVYCNLENPAITAEVVLGNSPDFTPVMKTRISTIAQLYSSLTQPQVRLLHRHHPGRR